MQNADLRRVVGVAHLGDTLEVLIAVKTDTGRTCAVIVGDECRRRHLGGDGERE